MARRNVVWTKTADIQFAGILEYWVQRNKSNTYSIKLVKAVREKTKLLAEKPLISKATSYNNTRIASLGHFSILYKVEEREIIITAFWDNRQDPKKLIDLLKKVP